MRKKSCAVATAGAVLMLCAPSAWANTIELVDPAAISDAEAVENGINTMSERVKGCARDEPASACVCKFPQDYAALKRAYDAALQKHHDWQDQIIFYRKGKLSVNISFDGLKRQFSATTCRDGTSAPPK